MERRSPSLRCGIVKQIKSHFREILKRFIIRRAVHFYVGQFHADGMLIFRFDSACVFAIAPLAHKHTQSPYNQALQSPKLFGKCCITTTTILTTILATIKTTKAAQNDLVWVVMRSWYWCRLEIMRLLHGRCADCVDRFRCADCVDRFSTTRFPARLLQRTEKSIHGTFPVYKCQIFIEFTSKL